MFIFTKECLFLPKNVAISQSYRTRLPAHAVARVAQLSRLLACRRTHPHVIAGLQQ